MLQMICCDVNWFVDLNLLCCYYGGVSLLISLENVLYIVCQWMFYDEKWCIVVFVVLYIFDQVLLFINFGMMIEEVVCVLNCYYGLYVIMNNLNVVLMMSGYFDCEVLIMGGIVWLWDKGIVGEFVIDFICQFKVDYVIIGMLVIEVDGMLCDFDMCEVCVVEVIMQYVCMVYFVIDYLKVGCLVLVCQGYLSQVYVFFIDKLLLFEMVDMVVVVGIQVYVVE